MSKIKRLILVGLALGALLLAGCQDDGGTTDLGTIAVRGPSGQYVQ